jgi:hypothetical protein
LEFQNSKTKNAQNSQEQNIPPFTHKKENEDPQNDKKQIEDPSA